MENGRKLTFRNNGLSSLTVLFISLITGLIYLFAEIYLWDSTALSLLVNGISGPINLVITTISLGAILTLAKISDNDINTGDSGKLESEIEEGKLVGKRTKDLRLKNELLEQMMEVAKMGAWDLDLERQHLTWSRQVYDIHEIEDDKKIELEEAINFYHPDYRSEIEEAVKNGMENGDPWDLELKLITARNNEIWIRAMGFPMYSENDKLIGLRGLFQNIDKQKSAEIEREENERNLNAILENTEDFIWSVNRNLELITFNTPFAKSIESILKEYPKKGDQLLNPGFGEDMNEIWKAYYKRVFAGESYSDEFSFGREGSDYFSEVNFNPIYDENGVVTGCSCFMRDITEKKKTIQDLQQSEAKLKETQKIAKIGNWEWESKKDIFGWSDQLLKILGREQEHMGSDLASFLSLVHEDDRTNVEHNIRGSAKSNRTMDINARIVIQDGTDRIIQIRAKGSNLEDQATVLIGNMQDITKQSKLQEELVANLKFQEILANISVNFNLPLPFEQKINYALEFVGKTVGISRAFIFEDLEDGAISNASFNWTEPNKKVQDELNLVNYEKDMPSWRHYLEKYGSIDSSEFESLPIDVRDFLKKNDLGTILVFPLHIDNRLIGFAGISDFSSLKHWTTSERKLLESVSGIISHAFKERESQRQIKESEERFRSLFENSSIGMARLAMSGQWLEVNNALVDTFGYSREELYLIDFQKITHPNDLEKGMIETKNVVDGKMPYAQFEKRYLHKNGKYIWCQLNFTVVKDNNGNPKYYISQIQNISDRIEAEEKVSRLYATMEEKVAHRTAQLNSTNKELEAFSYSVSHDLRTPLRSIHGFSQALQEDYAQQLDEIGRDYLGRICKSANRMGILIDDLLNLSKISRQDLSVVPIDVTEIVKNTITRLSPKKKYKFKVQEGMIAVGDRQMVGIIYDNIISNAIKYSKKVKQPKIKIGTMDSESGGTVYFVKDNGAGFDMSYVGKIFGAFQRLHSKKEFEGTGIGLATVQRIINKHGGKIWAESKLNDGATFYFHLGYKEIDN